MVLKTETVNKQINDRKMNRIVHSLNQWHLSCLTMYWWGHLERMCVLCLRSHRPVLKTPIGVIRTCQNRFRTENFGLNLKSEAKANTW